MSLKYAESIKEGSHEPRQAKPRHILRAVRLRCEHVLRYEHAKATYRARAEPQTSPRKPKGAWHCFHSHWIATGIAAITRTGPRLNLLRAAPPAAPVQPGAVHIRVTAVLLPPSGAKPTRSAWAMEAHDVAADGTQSERLRASGAIATAATHAANRREVAAPRHTWQVALQVATGRRRRYAAQQRSRGRSVAISLPSATTARDLQPPLPLTATAQPRRGARRTSHRNIARNNFQRLQRLQDQETSVQIRVDASQTPPQLQTDAESAAHAGDLRGRLQAPGVAAHAIPIWDELRTWDPGEG